MGRQVEPDADFDSRRDQAPRVEGDALHGQAVPGRCGTRRAALVTHAVRRAGATCGATPEDDRGTAARGRWECCPATGTSERAPEHPDAGRPRIANRGANGSPDARRAWVRRRFGSVVTVVHGDAREFGLSLARADRQSDPKDDQCDNGGHEAGARPQLAHAYLPRRRWREDCTTTTSFGGSHVEPATRISRLVPPSWSMAAGSSVSASR